MLDEAGRELERGRRVARSGGFAVVQIQEMPRLEERFGGGTATQIATQVTDLLSDEPGPLVRVGVDRTGRLLVLMPETAPQDVRRQLGDLARRIAATRFALGNEDTVRVTPVTGWVPFSGAGSGEELLERARTATRVAGHHLDLLPVEWTPELDAVPAESSAPEPARPRRGPAPAPGAVPGHPGAGHRPAVRAVPRARQPRLGRLRRRLLGRHGRPRGHRRVDLDRGPLRLRPAAAARGAGCAVPLRLGRDRGVPAQRGGHHPGHRRGLPAGGLPRRPADRGRLQHPGPDGGRGRAARDGPPGPADPAAQGGEQHLEGAERERRDEPPHRRVRRHVRRRPPPRARRLPPCLALAVERVRRGAGALRDPQRRRLPGRPHGRRRVRVHLRGQPPGPHRDARLRCLRRLQRLLAHQPAGPDPDARLDAHRGHRLHAAGAGLGLQDRLRPGAGLLRARAHQRLVAVEAAGPLGAGLVPGLPQAPEPDLPVPAPQRPAEERPGVPAGLARDLPLALAADVPGARLHRLPRRRHHPAELAGAVPDPGHLVHAGRRPRPDAVRLAAGGARDPGALLLVLEPPAGLVAGLHRVEEHHRPDRPDQGAGGRVAVERHPAQRRRRAPGPRPSPPPAPPPRR